MPPACEAMTTWVARVRSSVIDRYSSRSIAGACSTHTERTRMPSGGVCGVVSRIPRIWAAAAPAAAASAATLMPPALPRPPAWTWALTTTRPPSRCAISRARAGVSATSPSGTGTPNSRRRSLAWYSWIFTRAGSRGLFAPAAELAQEPDDRIVVVGHPLLHGNDPVVGDVDVLRADLRAALRDVAQTDPGLGADEFGAVEGVQRVHVQPGDLDEEARPRERRLELLVV